MKRQHIIIGAALVSVLAGGAAFAIDSHPQPRNPDYLRPDGTVDTRKAVSENNGWTPVWLPGGGTGWARTADVYRGKRVRVYRTQDTSQPPIEVDP